MTDVAQRRDGGIDRWGFHAVGRDDAERQGAVGLAVGVELDQRGLVVADGWHAGVEHRRDPGRRRLGQPAAQQGAHRLGSDWLDGVDQTENRVDLQHVAGRLTMFVAHVVTEPGDRVRGVAGDAGRVERRAVGPQAVPVDGEEEPRPVREHPVQVGTRRSVGAEHVHPPTESAHRAGRVVRRVALDRGQRVGARRYLQVHPGGEERSQEGMDVSLDEPGHQQLAAQVHHPGLRSGQRHGAGLRAHIGDGVAGDGQALCPGVGAGDGVDRAVVEHEVRNRIHAGRRGPRGRGCRAVGTGRDRPDGRRRQHRGGGAQQRTAGRRRIQCGEMRCPVTRGAHAPARMSCGTSKQDGTRNFAVATICGARCAARRASWRCPASGPWAWPPARSWNPAPPGGTPANRSA